MTTKNKADLDAQYIVIHTPYISNIGTNENTYTHTYISSYAWTSYIHTRKYTSANNTRHKHLSTLQPPQSQTSHKDNVTHNLVEALTAKLLF